MRRLLLLITLISGFTGISYSQSQSIVECGTEATPDQIRYMTKTRHLRNTPFSEKSATTIFVPVQHHIVRTSAGTGGLNPSELTSVMIKLNHYYGAVNMVFYECAPVNFIDDDTYYNFNSSQESVFGPANDVSGVINIYYFNTLSSGSSALCGYTRFPPSPDRVMMRNSCVSGATIVHELGHYFSLYHTHGKTNTGTTDELVNGSNCSTGGDELCDTPADPNLSGVVNSACTYTGTALDLNSDPFDPDEDNIMSYSRKVCRNYMSPGQISRARNSAINDRNYVTCSSPSTPIAAFSSSTTSSCDGIVTFYDESTSLPSQWLWNFGDGTTSTEQNPTHIYTQSGTYTVSLTSTNNSGSDVESITSYVQVSLDPSPSVMTPDSACEGQNINLSVNSSGSFNWYVDESSESPFITGAQISTGPIFGDTAFYVAEVNSNPSINVGPNDNTYSSGSNQTSYAYLVFNSFKPFTLKSVKVYANGAGNRTIQLRDEFDIVIQDTTVFIPNGQQTVTLNFNVPEQDNLRLGTKMTSEANLYKNNSASYPYFDVNALSITGSSSGNNYFFFYDWKIELSDCTSERVRVPVYLKDCYVGDAEIMQQLENIEMMPNPSQGMLTINNKYFEDVQIDITDLRGTSVKSLRLIKGRQEVDLQDLKDGLYLVHYTVGDVRVVKKLIRN